MPKKETQKRKYTKRTDTSKGKAGVDVFLQDLQDRKKENKYVLDHFGEPEFRVYFHGFAMSRGKTRKEAEDNLTKQHDINPCRRIQIDTLPKMYWKSFVANIPGLVTYLLFAFTAAIQINVFGIMTRIASKAMPEYKFMIILMSVMFTGFIIITTFKIMNKIRFRLSLMM